MVVALSCGGRVIETTNAEKPVPTGPLDKQCLRELRSWDADADGLVDSVVTYEYDERSNVTRWAVQYTPPSSQANRFATYTYDEEGQLLRQEADDDGDGAVESVELKFYDEQGFLLRTEETSPSVSTVTTYENDTQGQVVRRTVESNIDTLNEIRSYQYDQRGNLIRWTSKVPGNTSELIVESTYDENDQVLVQLTLTSLSGAVTQYQRTTFRYDEQGRTVSTIFVLGDQSGEHVDSATTISYEENGTERAATDYGGDGEPNQLVSRHFDEQGRLLKEEQDFDADGKLDEVSTYVYDQHAEWVRLEVDAQSGGLDALTERSFDDEGRLVGYTSDIDGDGTWDDKWTTGYESLSCES